MNRFFTFLSGLLLLFFVSVYSPKHAFAQFNFRVIPCQTAEEVLALIDTVFLKGVSPNAIDNITFSGDPTAVGYFTNAYFTGFSHPEGIIMTTGKSDDADKPNLCDNSVNANTDNGGVNGDPDLTAIGNQPSRDGCIIEFDFRPSADTVRFNYVFASDEYHEWVSPPYNDSFGFFLSGDGIAGPYSNNSKNIALIPGTNMAVSISNVNMGDYDPQNCNGGPTGCNYCMYLNDNSQKAGNPTFDRFVYDAYTTNLMAKSATTQCEWYHIKLAIGDGTDAAYDSGVLLESGSFNPGNVSALPESSNPGIADSILYESCQGQETVLYFSVAEPLGFPYVIPFEVSGQADRDYDYELFSTTMGDTIYIEAGELYDSLILRPYADAEVEGLETIKISYNPEMCNSFGTSKDTVRIYLSDVPEFNDTVLSFNSYCEDTVTLGFQGALNGIAPYSYNWFSYGDDPTIQYIISGTDSVSIPCLVTDICGYEALNHAVVKVPDLNTDAGVDIYLCNVVDTMLNGISAGAQHFSWSSVPYDPSLYVNQQDTLPNPHVSPAWTTTYTLMATDNCTNADDDEVLVSRDGLVAEAQGPGGVCLGELVMLTCTDGILHEWTCPTDPSVSGQNNDTIYVTPPAPGTYTYTVVVHDDCGNMDDTQVVVTVHDLPPANAGLDGEVCFGLSFQLEELGGGMHYQWSSVPNDPSLFVNGQDTTAQPIVTPPTQEDYTYEVTVVNEYGCVASDAMVLAVNPVPVIQLLPANTVICHDSVAILEVTGNALFNWTAIPTDPSLSGQNTNSVIMVNPMETTEYTVTATAAGFNCPATLSRIITVKPELFSTFDTQNNELCEGDEFTAVYTGNADPSASFVWDFDNPSSSVGSGGGPIYVSWDSDGQKNIWLTLTDDGCPSDTSFVTANVIRNPMASFVGDIIEGCDPLTVHFSSAASSNLSDPVTYSWDLGNHDLADLADTQTTYDSAGSYTVSLTITNEGMCENTATLTSYIHVFETPVADFDPDPVEAIIEAANIQFTDLTASSDGFATFWDFGDGTTSDESNPSHTYLAEGEYWVILSVETSNGCVHDTTKQVLIRPDVSVYVPTAFTPNGDGVNDLFEVKGAGFEHFKIQIFSRWGEMMFESQDLSVQWDGTFNGTLVPGGTYVYHIYYTNMILKEFTKKGTVSVIR